MHAKGNEQCGSDERPAFARKERMRINTLHLKAPKVASESRTISNVAQPVRKERDFTRPLEITGVMFKFTGVSVFERSLHDNLSGAHQKPAARHHLGLVKSAVQNKQIRV